MYLGSDAGVSSFLYMGLYVFSETYKLIQPLYKIIIICTLFYLVWHVLKTGDWLHSVGGYLFYVVLLLVLLSHTTTINYANIQSRSSAVKQPRSLTEREAELKEVSLSVGSIPVPTVFLSMIRTIDYFTNKLASIISRGKYLSEGFEYIHAQAAILNSTIKGPLRDDYVHFVEKCYSKARVDVANGKFAPNGRIFIPPEEFNWFIGLTPYVKMYENHDIVWKGEEISCHAAYKKLDAALIAKLGQEFVSKEKAEETLQAAWGRSKFKRWLLAPRRWWKRVGSDFYKAYVGTQDEMLYRTLLIQHKKMMDKNTKNKAIRGIMSGQQSGLMGLAENRILGYLGGALGVPLLLAYVSFFIRLAPLAQGACLCIIIGAFPILIFLSLFPRAIRVIKTAFLFYLQVSLWTVAWSIVMLLSKSMARFLPGSFELTRIDIPILTLLMLVAAPIFSSIFISASTSALSSLNVPVGNPAGAITAAKGAVK